MNFNLDPNLMSSFAVYSHTKPTPAAPLETYFTQPFLYPFSYYNLDAIDYDMTAPKFQDTSILQETRLFGSKSLPNLMEDSSIVSNSEECDNSEGSRNSEECGHSEDCGHSVDCGRSENGSMENFKAEDVDPRKSLEPTIFEIFTENSLDWCRYCGVTQAAQTAAFRPGPWGKRTLCNKHGCDYKGYGYIEKEPRLNLTAFTSESCDERTRPILQDWCAKCYKPESTIDNILVQCDGCCRGINQSDLAYHQLCGDDDRTTIPQSIFDRDSKKKWYCSSTCEGDSEEGLVKIEVPKRNLPLMKSTVKLSADGAVKKPKRDVSKKKKSDLPKVPKLTKKQKKDILENMKALGGLHASQHIH